MPCELFSVFPSIEIWPLVLYNTPCELRRFLRLSDKGENAMYEYEQITPAEAKKIIDSGVEHIVLDVREQDEFDAGHIPGAILIPYTSSLRSYPH